MANLREGFFSRLSKNYNEGDWKLIKPIAIQIDLITFSCSDSEAITIKSDITASLLVPAYNNPNPSAEASPITEAPARRISFSLSETVSFPEANPVNPKPKQAPCITT